MEGDGFEVDNAGHDIVTTPGTFDEDPANISGNTTRPGSVIKTSGTYPLGIVRYHAFERSDSYTKNYQQWDPDARFFQ